MHIALISMMHLYIRIVYLECVKVFKKHFTVYLERVKVFEKHSTLCLGICHTEEDPNKGQKTFLVSWSVSHVGYGFLGLNQVPMNLILLRL